MRAPKSLAKFYEGTEQIVTIERDSPPRVLFSGEDLLLEDLPVGTKVIYPKPPIEGLSNVKSAIRWAINHPEGCDPLHAMLRPGMKVTVAIDDISLPLPPMRTPDARQQVLEVILPLLEESGVDDVHLVVAIALVSVVGPSLTISIALIAFFSWAGVGRIVRGQVLSLREAEYVQAARSLGASDWRIMFVDILPNVLAPVIVFTTLLIPGAIVAESTMSFLGLGVVPPTATWGNMLAEAIAYYRVAWWFVVCPGVALLVTTVAFNLLGDSVRDALDPRHQTLIAPAGGKDA